jgi:hypothetical protein
VTAPVVAIETRALSASVVPIQRREEKLADKLKVTAERVVERLAKIAFAELPNDYVRASDMRQACVDLGKHLGMFIEKYEHSHRRSSSTLTRSIWRSDG